MDAVTRQALVVARELDAANWDDVPVEAVAAWARYARPVLRDLVRHLDDIADLEDDNIDDDEDGKVDTAPLDALNTGDCPGSWALVHADSVDGNHITTCPQCKRFRQVYRAPRIDDMFRVARHDDPAKEVA